VSTVSTTPYKFKNLCDICQRLRSKEKKRESKNTQYIRDRVATTCLFAIRTRVQQRSDNVGTSVFDRRANILANALHLCSNTTYSSHDDQSGASHYRHIVTSLSTVKNRADCSVDDAQHNRPAHLDALWRLLGAIRCMYVQHAMIITQCCHLS